MLVAYSARAGTEADDGPLGGTSPFTTAFLKFVEVPRVEVRLMLGKVRDEVWRMTKRQEPSTYSSLGGDEAFLNPAGTTGGGPEQHSEAERRKALAETSQNIHELEVIVREFGDTSYGRIAKSRLVEMKRARLDEMKKRIEANSARISKKFDGSWAIAWTSEESCPSGKRTENYALHIREGLIQVPARDYLGFVSLDGEIQWEGNATKYGGYIEKIGILRGRNGSGTFVNTVGCRGTFKATKR